jgi:hypothetical protein
MVLAEVSERPWATTAQGRCPRVRHGEYGVASSSPVSYPPRIFETW